jgi:hypothetical protein
MGYPPIATVIYCKVHTEYMKFLHIYVERLKPEEILSLIKGEDLILSLVGDSMFHMNTTTTEV